MLALKEATSQILKMEHEEFNILSDSKSALELLQRESFHPIAYDINKNITKINLQGKTLRLFWIRAHVGTSGNERADELAKEAALKLKTSAHYGECPVSFVKRSLRQETVREWNERYTKSETAETTKLYFPDAIAAYKLVHKIKLSPKLVQVLTGHGGFADYLHRFKCKDNPACICDPNVPETATHVITECPQFGKKRFELEQRFGVQVTNKSLHWFLNNIETKKIFIEYCSGVTEVVINRNKS
ncbi:hypothetical protein O0L34_g14028 [Tuta absoluta]|nr:hypothetical protein O0L34_g14028 [Tuta absoluta]